ncbi:unnamed protein product [Schistosoma curassoni]|uniref:Protein krueppel n=1 Tax=Schistosoma curassoni TaxID=6186 RepID=A0A183JS19_9TREM|nr:unnamed protein product [Schistosoma curassoni]
MSSCPILFSRDSDGEAESEFRDNSLKVSNTSNPDTTSLCNEVTYCTQTPLVCGERKSLSNFICEYCKREFSQKVHLQKHIMSTHTKNKPFKCSVCSYQTVEKSHLKTHFRKHTGEKPFSCTLCTYRAAQHSTLKQHCIKKHRNAFLSCINCSVRLTTFLLLLEFSVFLRSIISFKLSTSSCFCFISSACWFNFSFKDNSSSVILSFCFCSSIL